MRRVFDVLFFSFVYWKSQEKRQLLKSLPLNSICLATVKSKVVNSKTTESRHFDEVVIGTEWIISFLKNCSFYGIQSDLDVDVTVGNNRKDSVDKNHISLVNMRLYEWNNVDGIMILFKRRSNGSTWADLRPQVIYCTRKTVLDHIAEHREESWKYDVQRSILDKLRGVLKCGQTLLF